MNKIERNEMSPAAFYICLASMIGLFSLGVWLINESEAGEFRSYIELTEAKDANNATTER